MNRYSDAYIEAAEILLEKVVIGPKYTGDTEET
jgi:hypothetical protein